MSWHLICYSTPRSRIISTQKFEATFSSETSVFTTPTQRHIQEDDTLHPYFLLLTSLYSASFLNLRKISYEEYSVTTLTAFKRGKGFCTSQPHYDPDSSLDIVIMNDNQAITTSCCDWLLTCESLTFLICPRYYEFSHFLRRPACKMAIRPKQ
jgi:hypothetical protein